MIPRWCLISASAASCCVSFLLHSGLPQLPQLSIVSLTLLAGAARHLMSTSKVSWDVVVSAAAAACTRPLHGSPSAQAQIIFLKAQAHRTDCSIAWYPVTCKLCQHTLLPTETSMHAGQLGVSKDQVTSAAHPHHSKVDQRGHRR